MLFEKLLGCRNLEGEEVGMIHKIFSVLGNEIVCSDPLRVACQEGVSRLESSGEVFTSELIRDQFILINEHFHSSKEPQKLPEVIARHASTHIIHRCTGYPNDVVGRVIG